MKIYLRNSKVAYIQGTKWQNKLSITIFNELFEQMEKLLEGFKIGFTMTLKKLGDLLTTLSQKL